MPGKAKIYILAYLTVVFKFFFMDNKKTCLCKGCGLVEDG